MQIGLITYPIEKSPAGVGTYVKHLVKNIIELDKENTYYLLHYLPSSNKIYSKNEILYNHYKYLPEMFSDSWYLRQNPKKFDLVHRFLPGGFLFNIKSKRIVTLHDLFMYEAYPFNRKLPIYLMRYFNRRSLQKADVILADSQFTKKKAIHSLQLNPDKIEIVYSGPGNIPDNGINDPVILRKKYALKRNYILFVSTIEPRKNLLALVKAFEIMKDRSAIQEDLVVVGKQGWDYQDTLTYIKHSPHKLSIRLVGFVPDSELPVFYRNASLFVYPSFMEGFGIPPLEAMYCGCPVLTSNTSSLPEVVRYPEMMFDPQNIQELVEKSLLLLTQKESREVNIQRGRENAQRFSWRKSAEQVIAVYNRLLESPSGDARR